MQAQKIDEILETTFTEREEGRDGVPAILASTYGPHAPGKCAEDFRELERMGFLTLDDGRVRLTDGGEERALLVVRRHRLTERLFRQLLSLGDAQSESHACELEHILSPEATDAICTLLGHPPTCPHGKPIPRGACCEAARRTVAPLVCAAQDLAIGATGRVVFIRPTQQDGIAQLAGLGLLPGTTLRLRQRLPAVVLEIGETVLAVDKQVAGSIFVQRV